MQDTLPGGFSRPIELGELTADGAALALRATDAERQLLAKRFGLAGLASFEGDLSVRANFAGEIEVSGRFKATVEQTCVVTLEVFSAGLGESFVLRFARGVVEEDEPERTWSASEEAPPDPIEGDVLDLGEILAQQLGLAIDPFPRRPGAAFDPTLLGAAAGEGRETPFALLAGLKIKRTD
jgi:Large ribosomal RNA subunit accumulation protein YceD